ncbi:MAG: NAD-dependent deacylase [Chloroflexi bacterium]|nr:NAD-dependent deacylase [Chloroflexota bacterium]MDA1145235.1 NAD-dependent deacylase [Chloroflexota bacterium]
MPQPFDLADHTGAIDLAVGLLARAGHTVVLAGAGMSKESGIPTFRGEDGLWTKHGEPPLNQFETFAADPRRWWERRIEQGRNDPFAQALEASQPNPGHVALAELEHLGILGHLITQNIDDLHRRAGQTSLTEIHGNRYWIRCLTCEARWPREEFVIDADALPPSCPECGSVVKSDTVMFGEPIPPTALRRCAEETAIADCFMTIGTSAVVYPAAQFPVDALRRGVPLIEVNPEPTPLTDFATVVIPGPSGEVLPAIVERLRARLGGGNGSANATADAADAKEQSMPERRDNE